MVSVGNQSAISKEERRKPDFPHCLQNANKSLMMFAWMLLCDGYIHVCCGFLPSPPTPLLTKKILLRMIACDSVPVIVPPAPVGGGVVVYIRW